ncbi:MAG: alginate O-acetyltransferase AlgX-related protein [Qingshengfaniella sp.]
MPGPQTSADKKIRSYLAILLGAILSLAIGLAGFALWMAPPSGDLVRIGGWSSRHHGWQGPKIGFADDLYTSTTTSALLDGAPPGEILIFGDSFSIKHDGGISWINTLQAETGREVRFVRIQGFAEIQRYLRSDAFRHAPPAAMIVQTVERELIRRAAETAGGDCHPPAPPLWLARQAPRPISTPDQPFTQRTHFDNMDELFSWGALALRKTLAGGGETRRVALSRNDLFSSPASGHLLLYDRDILLHTADAFPQSNPDRAAQTALCGLRQMAGDVGQIPFRLVIAPDKRSVYADWITTPLPTKEIDLFTLAEEALGDSFVNLQPALTEAAETIPDIYYPDDSHWGPAGHRLAGHAVSAALLAVP